MTDLGPYWNRVVDCLKGGGFRFRIKWNGDDELAAWQTWVICPVPGYLESGCGPISVSDVQWLEIATSDHDGADRRGAIFAALASMDIRFRETDEAIQVMPHVI